jgi:biopolymer transport protein ExbD
LLHQKVGDSQFLTLDLPKTESFQNNTVESSNEISIINDGSVYINGEVFNINDLDSLNEAVFELNNNGSSIILSADAAALHVWVINIMDILNKNGFNEVQIRTIEQ